jgi:oligoribonuclease NrnB/cAMP/cGMP phosphodiesterase (DHH superfamily)
MNKDFLESTKYKINSIINDLAYENNGEYTMLIADLEIAEERVEELEEEDGKK